MAANPNNQHSLESMQIFVKFSYTIIEAKIFEKIGNCTHGRGSSTSFNLGVSSLPTKKMWQENALIFRFQLRNKFRVRVLGFFLDFIVTTLFGFLAKMNHSICCSMAAGISHHSLCPPIIISFVHAKRQNSVIIMPPSEIFREKQKNKKIGPKTCMQFPLPPTSLLNFVIISSRFIYYIGF